MNAVTENTIGYDPFSPEVMANPLPFYARLRREAEAAMRSLKALAAEKELEALLNGEADGNDAYLEVHAGAGGTESAVAEFDQVEYPVIFHARTL